MQTLRNPLSIFRARSRSREKNTSQQAVTQPEKPDKSRNKNESTNEKKSITVSSDNYIKADRKKSESKPDKATTQKLFIKRDKKSSECLAETKIERKSVCREKTHMSIVLPQPRFYTCERIQKTVKIPENLDPEMSKKSTHWCYVAAPKHTTLKQGPSIERSSEPRGNGFSTESMIEEIFAPLRETIKEGIKETRHLSSSPEKVKLNHTPSTRLELWKAQLNSTNPRTRDASAPAAVQRLTIKPQTTQLNITRPIHTTQSASNALAAMDHRTLKDISVRRRSGTWQVYTSNTYNADRPPIDFVTSPKYSHQESAIFRPIAHRPKPDFINHNDNNRRSFRRVDSILRSESKESNGSLSDLLMMYHGKDANREMNASIRSTASNSSSFPFYSPEQINQTKNVLTTLSSSSSGIHVTPSPSDSGIIDYENLIRDKEMELQEIRSTMEQNEEIIIKVYQDKERAWKTELEGLKCRVTAAEKGEKALREQLSNCQRQNTAMSSCMRTVQEEKTRLMAKCIQLEKEVDNLHNVSLRSAGCPNCSVSSFIKEEKEKDLRQEVQDLRREVANLKQVVDNGRNLKS